MATYVISDIHGAFDEFNALLDKIHLRFDGQDQLYLLGDYGDWNPKSMDAIQFVRELDESYNFVHCAMGNHEQLFLQTVDSGFDGKVLNEPAVNWIYNNRGLVTWNAYRSMPPGERKTLIHWMRNLRYSFDVTVNGVHYMLAHAYPYYYDVQTDARNTAARQNEAIWRRLMIRENPFSGYTGSRHYDMLICGHTISDVYYQELRYEKDWPYRKPGQTVRNRIFHGEKFIDIDCGAKCMEMQPDAGDVLQIATMRAQLACLRLDDLMGVYVHRPSVAMPELTVPEFSMPQLSIPGIRAPQFHVPDLQGFKVPEFLPHISERDSSGEMNV